MKRFILISVLFSTAVMTMERPMTHAYVEREAKHKKSDALGQELLGIIRQLDYEKRLKKNIVISPEQMQAIKSLLAQGANVNVIDLSSLTAIYYALEIQNNEIIKLLIQNGANLNIQDSQGGTPLHYYISHVYQASPEIIKLMVEYGADINIQNKGGKTPLMLAAYWGNVPTVRLLINGIQETQGLEQIGIQHDKTYFSLLPTEIRKITFEHLKMRADPNITDTNGNTALSLAIKFLEEMLAHPNGYQDVDQRIRNYEEIINILEPITRLRVSKTQSWWKRWFGY